MTLDPPPRLPRGPGSPVSGRGAIPAKCPRVYTLLKQFASGVPMTAVFRTVRLALSLLLGLVYCSASLRARRRRAPGSAAGARQGDGRRNHLRRKHHEDPAAGSRLRLLHRQGLLRRSRGPVCRRRHIPVGRRRCLQGQGAHPRTADAPGRRQHEGGRGTCPSVASTCACNCNRWSPLRPTARARRPAGANGDCWANTRRPRSGATR